MSIGRKIKQLRELRNFTQNYMADQLGMSVNGYGKIERDETDVSVKRLQQIAKVLETDLNTLLNFEARHVFNLYHNQTALANGTVQTQQIITGKEAAGLLRTLQQEIEQLKTELQHLKQKK